MVRGCDHLRLRTAASVAPTKKVERSVRADPVFEVAHAPLNLVGAEAAVVRVGGREVREDARPVDSLPEKGVVLWLVGVVPRKLLGQKKVAARLARKLRQVARIAEDVGQPEDPRLVAELAREKPLAVQQLSHQRLAG